VTVVGLISRQAFFTFASYVDVMLIFFIAVTRITFRWTFRLSRTSKFL